VLLVHKYKRAPYGGGKFWREARSALQLLCAYRPGVHPLLKQYLGAIAQDLGRGEVEPSTLPAAMGDQVGPRVEMRRWWTHYDASTDLVRHWHCLLVAILAQEMMSGRNPFERPEAQGQPPRSEAQRGSPFAFKDAVLSALLNSSYLGLLRSNIVVFRPLRTHFAAFIQCSGHVQRSMDFMRCWADPGTWFSTLVKPALTQCFQAVGTWHELGLPSKVGPFEVPLSPSVPDASEAAELLLLHLRQGMEMVNQLVYFGILYQTPPWCFCLLLDRTGDALRSLLARLRNVWRTVLAIESSPDPAIHALSKDFFWFRWPVFREVLLLLEEDGWQSVGQKVVSYVEAMFVGVTNTMSCENAFNDLRDHEQRTAKHTRRSHAFSQAVAIRSLEQRKTDLEVVTLGPEDIQAAARWHVTGDTFEAEARDAHARPHLEGIDLNRVTASDWSSTSSRLFSTASCLRLQALQMVPQEQWQDLWLAGVFRAHLLLREASPQPPLLPRWLYVIGVTSYLLVACVLSEGPGNHLSLPAGRADSVVFLPVVSWDAFWVHDFHLSLGLLAPGVMLFTPGSGHPLLRFCLERYAHELPLTVLWKACQSLGVACRRTSTLVEFLAALLAHAGVAGDAAKRVLERAKALQERRARAKRVEPEEADGEVDGGGLDLDPDLAPNPVDMECLHELAPSEVAYLHGRLPASAGLAEEDIPGPGEGNEGAAAPDPAASAGAGASSSQAPPQDQQPADRQGAHSWSVPELDSCVPLGCTLRLLHSTDQGPMWTGALPSWRGAYLGNKTRSRSFAEGAFSGCGRTSSQAKAEVVRWLQDAMHGHHEPRAEPSSTPAPRGTKRKTTSSALGVSSQPSGAPSSAPRR